MFNNTFRSIIASFATLALSGHFSGWPPSAMRSALRLVPAVRPAQWSSCLSRSYYLRQRPYMIRYERAPCNYMYTYFHMHIHAYNLHRYALLLLSLLSILICNIFFDYHTRKDTMGRTSKQKQRLRAIARLRFEAPIDPGRESSFTAPQRILSVPNVKWHTPWSGEAREKPQGKANGSWRKEKVEGSWFRISCYPGLDSTCSHYPELVKKNCRVLEYHLRLRYSMNTARKKDIGIAKCFLSRPSTELYPLQRRFIRVTSSSSYSTMRRATRFMRPMRSGHRK